MLISIAFHEHPQAILFQLNNIRKFAPSAIVVCHLSNRIVNKIKLPSINNLIVNPKSFATGYMDRSLFFVHISNILHARQVLGKQLNLALMGSNELFVKSGVEKYISLNNFQTELANKDDFHFKGYIADPDFKWLLDKRQFITKSMPEGSFYSAEQVENGLSDLMVNMDYQKAEKKFEQLPKLRRLKTFYERGITKVFSQNLNSGITYAAEEILIPTLFNASVGINNSYCHSHPSENFICKNNDYQLIKESQTKFSFKRVERNPNSKDRYETLKRLELI